MCLALANRTVANITEAKNEEVLKLGGLFSCCNHPVRKPELACQRMRDHVEGGPRDRAAPDKAISSKPDQTAHCLTIDA